MADDEVESYLRAVANQTRQAFAQGCGSFRRTAARGGSPRATTVATPQQPPVVGVRLPARKKLRSTSPERDAPPAPPASRQAAPTAPLSTASPKPPSLLSRYFPSALRAPTLSTTQLPSPDLRDATVARIDQWRARVVMIRLSLQGNSTDSSTALTQRQARHFHKQLQGMRRAAQFPTDSSSLTEWHRYFDECGPTQGNAPPSRLLVLLDEAESNLLMHVVCTRILRGQRGTDFVTPTANAPEVEPDDDSDEESADGGSGGEEAKGKLFINDEDDEDRDVPDDDEAPSADAKPALRRFRINSFPQLFDSSLTLDQVETLRFFRHLMPIQMLSDDGQLVANSSGLGAWFFALAAAVDLPVDPELDRVFNDLFKACCKHITVLSEHFAGSSVPLLARVEAAAAHRSGPLGNKQYWSMSDVGSSEVLALYTVLVILAKVLRQNQNNLVPI